MVQRPLRVKIKQKEKRLNKIHDSFCDALLLRKYILY